MNMDNEIDAAIRIRGGWAFMSRWFIHRDGDDRVEVITPTEWTAQEVLSHPQVSGLGPQGLTRDVSVVVIANPS